MSATEPSPLQGAARAAIARALEHFAGQHIEGGGATTTYTIASYFVAEVARLAPAAHYWPRGGARALAHGIEAAGLHDDPDAPRMSGQEIDSLAEEIHIHARAGQARARELAPQ